MRDDLEPLNLYDRYWLLSTSVDMLVEDHTNIRHELMNAYIEDGEDPESFECAEEIAEIMNAMRIAELPELLSNMTWDGDADVLLELMRLDVKRSTRAPRNPLEG